MPKSQSRAGGAASWQVNTTTPPEAFHLLKHYGIDVATTDGPVSTKYDDNKTLNAKLAAWREASKRGPEDHCSVPNVDPHFVVA